MTTREIQGHLQEIYGVEVSLSLISEITDAVMEQVKGWSGRWSHSIGTTAPRLLGDLRDATEQQSCSSLARTVESRAPQSSSTWRGHPLAASHATPQSATTFARSSR